MKKARNKEFSSLYDLMDEFTDEQTCIDHFEEIRWNGNVISPFDKTSKVYKCANNRYRCKNTSKYFNYRTGTIFEDSKIALRKWFMAIYLQSAHKKGISSHQLARDIHVTQKTGWFMLQRIRYAMENHSFVRRLEGTVEVDETFIGGKERNKHKNKKAFDPYNHRNKATVIGIVKRGGEAKAFVSEDRTAKHLIPKVLKNVKPFTRLMTDQYFVYKRLQGYYKHQTVEHSAREYVRGDIHTNTVEGLFSLLKRSVVGIYHWVSPKHLQKYVSEAILHYNTRNFSERKRFNFVLANFCNKRLTYIELTDE